MNDINFYDYVGWKEQIIRERCNAVMEHRV